MGSQSTRRGPRVDLTNIIYLGRRLDPLLFISRHSKIEMIITVKQALLSAGMIIPGEQRMAGRG